MSSLIKGRIPLPAAAPLAGGLADEDLMPTGGEALVDLEADIDVRPVDIEVEFTPREGRRRSNAVPDHA
jgi:hypothetical protein